MRLAVCALSAVLLSGCSWLGGFGSSGHGYNQAQNGSQYGHQGQYGAQYASQRAGQNMHGGGFPQKPDFNGGYGTANYTTGGYGSHAGDASQQGGNYKGAPKLKKPKLRGSLSMGFEKSVGGEFLDYTKIPTIDPVAGYDPNLFLERFVEGTRQSGSITTTTYSAVEEEVARPTISNSDVYSTPFSLRGGFEYILSPNTTLFANAGYTFSEGEDGSAVGIQGTLTKFTSIQGYVAEPPPPPVATDVTSTTTDPMTGVMTTTTTTVLVDQPASGLYIPDGGPSQFLGEIENQNIANFSYDFSDMKRIDLEVGGRHYFSPIVKDQAHRTVTPFVGASVGASHVNAQSYKIGQYQLHYRQAYEDNDHQFFEPNQATGQTTAAVGQRVDLYDAQWVPNGSLTAGMEWQVTPKTALALESGLRFEGARKYTNGTKTDSNFTVPLTLRGSFNF